MYSLGIPIDGRLCAERKESSLWGCPTHSRHPIPLLMLPPAVLAFELLIKPPNGTSPPLLTKVLFGFNQSIGALPGNRDYLSHITR